MPCYDPVWGVQSDNPDVNYRDAVEARIRVDELTQILCRTMKQLETQFPMAYRALDINTLMWWKEHKQFDESKTRL